VRDAAQQRLDVAIAGLPENVVQIVDPNVVFGEVATALLELAEDAELLVLGNPSQVALSAAVLGSIALRCAHHARCPVVLVPG
jgi:nucleotide-binding universal stress UspA family protein